MRKGYKLHTNYSDFSKFQLNWENFAAAQAAVEE